MRDIKRIAGLTMIELMITVAVAGILVTLAVASYQSLATKKRIKHATETLYADMKFAHSESIKRQANIFVSFVSGANWCYGIDDAAACDCSVSNDCQIDGVEKVVRSTDFNGVTMSRSGYTTGGGEAYVQFEGTRGVASDSGSVTFSQSGFSTTVSANKIGLIQNCSNTLVTYNACP